MVRFVVMAAGKASRMGEDKLALRWGDTTILGQVLRTVMQTVLLTEARHSKQTLECEITVVARKPMTEFRLGSLPGFSPETSFQWIHVPSPRPLSHTIHLGLSELPERVQGICFIPGDQVGLEPKVLSELTDYFFENKPDFLMPQAGEITGSPVFFHRRFLPDLLALQGEQGGRTVLEKYRDRWTSYSVGEEFFLDIDTKEDYERSSKQN